jgi:hypothetical protein
MASLLYRPSPLEVLNSPGTFDPSRHEHIAATYLRSATGMELPSGEPVDEEGVWAYWMEKIVGLIVSGHDFVGIIDGDPGEGKSTLGLEFCLRLRNALNVVLGADDVFDIRRDVIYRLSNLLYRILQSSPDRRVILQADEGCMVGAQAKSGMSEEGAILDRALSVCRIKGVSLFVLHPTIRGVASAIRQRRGRNWFHVERRGTATAFRMRTSLPKDLLRDLPFTKEREPFARITFRSLEDDPRWSIYSEAKIEETNRELLDLALRAVALEYARGLAPPPWAIPYLDKRRPRWWAQETGRPGNTARGVPPSRAPHRSRQVVQPSTGFKRWVSG